MISRSQIDNSGGALPPESLEKVRTGHREERAKVDPGLQSLLRWLVHEAFLV